MTIRLNNRLQKTWSNKIEWPIVPAIGEKIFYNGNEFVVKERVHDMENGYVALICDHFTKPERPKKENTTTFQSSV